MPKPTATEIRHHKAFLERQDRYESEYAKKFYHLLNRINWAVWQNISKNGNFNSWESVLDSKQWFEPIYRKLYIELTLKEAKRHYRKELPQLEKSAGVEVQTKDIIDELTRILAGSTPKGEVIQLWKNLLDNYIGVRILDRIKQVSKTTKQRIAELIEKGVNEGINPRKIAGKIKTDYKYNRNRALTIARTESISAMNQGKFMSALSSKYAMQKRWIPVAGPRTRLWHLDMLDSEFIDIMKMFQVRNAHGITEYGLFPCAPSFTASNVCNCRCSISFRIKRDANGRIIRK